MIIESKKIQSFALILLFSFFSAFALNVTLVNFNAVAIEESISSSEEEHNVSSPQNSFIFLDEVHHEETMNFASVIFHLSFNNLLNLYIDPYLNSPIIPPRV